MNEEAKELIRDIVYLSIDITISEKPDVFFEFYALTKQLELRVYKDGWEMDSTWDIKKSVYLDENLNLMVRKLNNIKDFLENLQVEYASSL